MPEKRLSKKEMEEAIVDLHKSEPIVLNEKEFRNEMKRTVLSRINRGELHIDNVKKNLSELSKKLKSEGLKVDLDLEIENLEEALVAFQYAARWHNCANAKAVKDSIRNFPQIWFGKSTK